MYKKENSTKLIIMGTLLLALGILSFLYEGIGIKIVSWTLAVVLLFIAYLNLKNINELKRYATKTEIAPFTSIQFILLFCAILLTLFPNKIQGLISSILGIYYIYSQLLRILKSRNNPYYKLGFGSIFKLIFWFVLVLSPFFLSRFIASILSLLIILLGVHLLSTGNRLKI
ncbi:hypothetical protein [Romboutsia sp.]|uniref:hypothetical protein n=1 Tax=Romboutsia sp. TaxID=1965302 RepID=UPI002B607823|nr:hypothetical protein [Romboutsia sp.]HSQ88842.1 hypothetical protein [Romboutsia sp.]